jgi:hypothetical protein
MSRVVRTAYTLLPAIAVATGERGIASSFLHGRHACLGSLPDLAVSMDDGMHNKQGLPSRREGAGLNYRGLLADDRCGSDSDFRVPMTVTIKAGMPRNRTGIGRRLKTTQADALCKQRSRACTRDP